MKKFFATVMFAVLSTFTFADNYLTVASDPAKPGENAVLKVNLSRNGKTDLTAAEIHIDLPDCLETRIDAEAEDFYWFNLDDMTTYNSKKKTYGHEGQGKIVNDGRRVNLVASSSSLVLFQNDGLMFEVYVKVKEDAKPGTYTIDCKDNVVSGTDAVSIEDPGTFEFVVAGDASGINNVESDKSNSVYYTVGGQTTSAPQKGLSLVKTANGVKKVMVK